MITYVEKEKFVMWSMISLFSVIITNSGIPTKIRKNWIWFKKSLRFQYQPHCDNVFIYFRSSNITTYGKAKVAVILIALFSLVYNIPRFFEVTWGIPSSEVKRFISVNVHRFYLYIPFSCFKKVIYHAEWGREGV